MTGCKSTMSQCRRKVRMGYKIICVAKFSEIHPRHVWLIRLIFKTPEMITVIHIHKYTLFCSKHGQLLLRQKHLQNKLCENITCVNLAGDCGLKHRLVYQPIYVWVIRVILNLQLEGFETFISINTLSCCQCMLLEISAYTLNLLTKSNFRTRPCQRDWLHMSWSNYKSKMQNDIDVVAIVLYSTEIPNQTFIKH